MLSGEKQILYNQRKASWSSLVCSWKCSDIGADEFLSRDELISVLTNRNVLFFADPAAAARENDREWYENQWWTFGRGVFFSLFLFLNVRDTFGWIERTNELCWEQKKTQLREAEEEKLPSSASFFFFFFYLPARRSERRIMGETCAKLLLLILSIFAPPLAVWIARSKICSCTVCVNLLLTCLGWVGPASLMRWGCIAILALSLLLLQVPGVIHAWCVICCCDNLEGWS